MNIPNDNIHTTLCIVQDKKGHFWASGRRTHLKSNLHSTSQADQNWKPIKAFAVHLGRKMGAMHRIYTRVGPKHQDLCMGIWNITSFNEKEQELVWKAEQYHLDIVGVSSTKCCD